MSKSDAALAGIVVLMASTAAMADPRAAQVPGGSQELHAPALPANPPSGQSGDLPLFTIGRLPVQVWSPVEAPYDANMNRNQAANPIFGSDVGMSALNGPAIIPLSATGAASP